MAIRVYELAKKLEMSNKDLIKKLQDLGFDISSHVSAVPAEAIDKVEASIKVQVPKSSQEKSNQEKPKMVRPQEPAPEKSQKITEEKPSMQQPRVLEVKYKKGPTKYVRPEIKQPIQAKKDVKVAIQEDLSVDLESTTPADIANKAKKSVSEVILTLLKQGVVAPINQRLSAEVARKLVDLYALTVKVNEVKKDENDPKMAAQAGEWQDRLPIVVVIGHVDHGKTTLLDFIRKTRVAAKEKGGITQHLGAYEVNTPHGDVVFLDTPGHEAFSMLRVRGLKAADIAILVVAADDGVMPQTVEAINHAKSVGLPIIVALNKIDKATAVQIDIAKQQLSKHGLTPEEWGGTTVFVPISAKMGTGIDVLLDVVVLQSQLMELKANMTVACRGYVLEAKMEKGRGPVATVICQHGTLKIGDYFFAGKSGGKVSSMTDSVGKSVTQAGPSIPVQVSGFDEVANAGEVFSVVTSSEFKKDERPKVQLLLQDILAKKSAHEGALNILVKTDNMSSKEALINAIEKLNKTVEKKFNIVFAGVGDIVERDVILASDTHSVVYALHVKTQPNAIQEGGRLKVVVRHFDIIYKLIENLEMVAKAAKTIKMITKKIGEAGVIKVFDIKSLGIVAGAMVKSGRFLKDGKVVIWRGKQKIGQGNIKGLQRDRKSVKEVHTGFEFAFLVDGFHDWQVDDRVECFQEEPETT